MNKTQARQKAVEKLRELANDTSQQWGNEYIHGEADDALIELLDVLAPEVAEEYRNLQAKITFWYS